ncbi:MAG: hypothetical protein BYD32DRAFT_462614 [Podila humilis]|nr:MAG: hypothetical protein BYD32DRAFT_462614 [Podila humilis]
MAASRVTSGSQSTRPQLSSTLNSAGTVKPNAASHLCISASVARATSGLRALALTSLGAISAPIIPKPVPLTLAQRGLAHLQNAESVDFAFVFKFPANNPRQKDHLVGLWSDQFTLATTSIEFKKFHRLVEQANWTLTPGSFSTTTNQVCEFSLLVPYCALLQYIYTGVLELKIDLSNFVITAMSVQPEQQRLERIFIDELKAGPRKVVPLLEVSQLAKKYGPRELAKQCKERLQSPMSPIVVLAESNTRERGNLLRLA